MSVHRHFGLSCPPFESDPDPRFFFRSPAADEALATLQYAVRTSKPCVLVVADSGCGKTLLGQMLWHSVGQRASVLWIHGLGQPENETEAQLFGPAALADPCRWAGPTSKTLSAWMRTAPGREPASLLIIDDADELPLHTWRELLALLTRDIGRPKPRVILSGLPKLFELLAAPELVRLRCRVFRTCLLPPLDGPLVDDYVAHRVRIAGGGEREVFTAAAIAQIRRVTHGIPSLINQVCDNALLEAWSEDRAQVDVVHVVGAIRAALPWPILTPPQLADVSVEPSAPPTARPLARTSVSTVARESVAPVAPQDEPRQLACSTAEDTPTQESPARPVLNLERPASSGTPVDAAHLRQLEARLTHALFLIRHATSWSARAATPIARSPRESPPRTAEAQTAATATPARPRRSLAERVRELQNRIAQTLASVRTARAAVDRSASASRVEPQPFAPAGAQLDAD